MNFEKEDLSVWNYKLRFKRSDSEDSGTNSVNNLLDRKEEKTGKVVEKKIGLVRESWLGIYNKIKI